MTIFLYQPQPNAPYQFSPTLDGQEYLAVTPWGLFGRRLYLTLTALDGTRIFTRALVGSPAAQAIQSLAWAHGTVTVTFTALHGYKLMSTVELAISGCLPDAYNGVVEAYVSSDTEVQYQLASDPGAATMLGEAGWGINLAAGYFSESRLIFRDAAQQFEAVP